MKQKRYIIIITLLLILLGCSPSKDTKLEKIRDNTPQVHLPTLGNKKITNNIVELDISNKSEGYIMLNYKASNKKVKVQITSPKNKDYIYPVTKTNEFITYPLPEKSGTYKITVLESIDTQSNRYAICFNKEIEVKLKNKYKPFLYANYYISFQKDSLCVKKAQELSKNCYTSLDVVSNIYHYIIKNITYDKQKAKNVQYGYVPCPDDTLKTKTGICFDYASLMSAMLRSQGIPTKLEVGYVEDVYHAWISCYVKEIGWVDHIIEFDGKNWSLVDPTLGANNTKSDVKKYIDDNHKYLVKYTY